MAPAACRPLSFSKAGRGWRSPAAREGGGAIARGDAALLPAQARKPRLVDDPFAGWQRNVTVIAVATFVAMAGYGSAFRFFPLYLGDLGVSDPARTQLWAGVISGAMTACVGIGVPIWGALADRVGRKMMLQRTLLGAMLFVGLMSLVRTPWQLLIVAICQGAFSGTQAAAMTMTSAITPRERQSTSLGLLQTTIFTGFFTGPLLGGYLADAIGFRWSFRVTAFLFLSAALAIGLLVREPLRQPSVATSVWRELNSALRLPALRPVLILAFLLGCGGALLGPVLPLFVAALPGGERAASATGVVLATAGACSALAALIISRWGERWRARPVLLAAAMGVGLAFLAGRLVQSVGQLAADQGLLGFCQGALLPTANVLVARAVPPERRGAAFGLFFSGSSAGQMVGPLLGGAVGAAFGARAVFLVGVALALVLLAWAARSRLEEA